MSSFEQLGAFYLGRELDDDGDGDILLYDSKDLTTHALCVGMTGSGKTGLCLSLLEEAGIDGIPAIAVDPKGDLANLLLTFPDLSPTDFEPWVDPSAAAQKGLSVEEYAKAQAEKWKKGLASWGQDGERIRRLRESVDLTIYTPGSSAGLPLSVLSSFAAPSEAVQHDADAFRERIAAAAAGLLALLDIEADPVRSREFILISKILEHAWTEGRDMHLATLIQAIQDPPFSRIGVLELDQFFGSKERMQLAMTLNGLLASPTFAGWLEGEPLDIQRLFYLPPLGKPRISIISIAHLSERERMFFLTILLNELLSWVRAQAGTPSLRAIFYMDEVFGYFPPVAAPPTKRPMLTLLKQARAYGLGIVLATQNPVDLDYRGLSNCGTWFLGRLQTQRDKERLIDGLQGATAESGQTIDRQELDRLLSRLDSRVFLMNNVHEDRPVRFQTRWALSYLRGPLTREQIAQLMAPQKETKAAQQSATEANEATAVAPTQKAHTTPKASSPPTVPNGILQHFLPCTQGGRPDERLVYHPTILGSAKLHFVRASYHIDSWQSAHCFAQPGHWDPTDPWARALVLRGTLPALMQKPASKASFAPLLDEMDDVQKYATWGRKLRDYLYAHETITVWKCTKLKMYSRSGENEEQFRVRIAQAAREERDRKLEQLRERYGKKIATAQNRIRRARQRLAAEKSQATQRTADTALSFGATIIGVLLGKKAYSRTNADRAASSARKGTRAAKELADVRRAQASLADETAKLAKIEKELEAELDELRLAYHIDTIPIESLVLKPLKKDLAVERIGVLWMPYWEHGTEQRPAFDPNWM